MCSAARVGGVTPPADPARWPSLAAQCVLAEHLFGDNGFGRVRTWLAAEFARVDDAEFAREFSAHVRLPGVVDGDFNHRLVTSARGDLLGGIRFYGRDIARPFVDIVCHSFGDLDELAECVAAEWAEFAAPWARLYARPGEQYPPGALQDLTVYVARCAEMTCPDHRVTLTAFRDPQDAVNLVQQRYLDLAAEHPELARRVTPADPADISDWHDTGFLHAVTVDDSVVGALAVAPGSVLWIDGYEINEEVILTSSAGNGYAAAAQSAWAHRTGSDPESLLVGTIDGRNHASRRTAARAGRHAVLDATFLGLHRRTSAQ